MLFSLLVSPAAAQAFAPHPCFDPASTVISSPACTCVRATRPVFYAGVVTAGTSPAGISGTCFDLPAKMAPLGAPPGVSASVQALYVKVGTGYAGLAWTWDPFWPSLVPLPVSTEEPEDVGVGHLSNGAVWPVDPWLVDTGSRALVSVLVEDMDGDGNDDLLVNVEGVWYEAWGPIPAGALLVVP